MNHRSVNRMIALCVFVVSMFVYYQTMPPTVVFWDVPEHCASAYLLQVQHPPGSPLLVLVMRLASMIPLSSDIAVRMIFLNAIISSIDITLLYLITIRLMMMWLKNQVSLAEKITMYGSAMIGAFALAWSTTFWFNSIEVETRNTSFLFTAVMIWLSLVWYEKDDDQRSDSYLLLIAYLVGLSSGVHIQGMLGFFVAILVFYFKHYKKSLKTFLFSRDSMKFGIIASLIFLTAYPGIVQWFPSMLNGNIFGIESDMWKAVPVAAVSAAVYGLYSSMKNKRRFVFLGSSAFLLILAGYSTYTFSLIRANSAIPINENSPNTISNLVTYLDRQQYGDTPLFNRRFSNEPDQVSNFNKYSSDLDYMWTYQINHMYLRYFGWNFIGRISDAQDAGVRFNQLYALPLLLGCIGFFYHWKRDPKMAFTMTIFFLLTGVVMAIYFNMQEPQPRERDYFFAPSFWTFCLWIGMGAKGILDDVKDRLKRVVPLSASMGILLIAFIAVPGNMLRTNEPVMSRRGHYLAWDYSYNLLQSCEKDAILITNGDNDTFPLWYLQDVDGVRQDIRVVNLSLGNLNWYIHQLKHDRPFGALPVPIDLSDEEIENIQPIQYQTRTVEIPVSPEARQKFEREFEEDGIQNAPIEDTVKFVMRATMHFGSVNALRAQDILVYDILQANHWKRPVYFAVTDGDDAKIGLTEYEELDGLAYKIIPVKHQNFWSEVNERRTYASLMTDVQIPSRTPAEGFRWRGLQVADVHLDENQRRMSESYRQIFFSLALNEINVKKDTSAAIRVVERMEKILPSSVVPFDYRMKFDFAQLCGICNAESLALPLYRNLVNETIQKRESHEQLTMYHPAIILAASYTALGKYDSARETYDRILEEYQTETPGIKQFILTKKKELQTLQNIADTNSHR